MARPRAIDVQTLVDAAARVFERRGFADSTLADVAAEAGISKPTIYQYVPSKQRLLEIIVEQVIYPLHDGIERIVSSSEPAAEKIEAYLALHVSSATRYKVYYQVLMADQHQLSPQGLRSYRSWARRVDHAAAQLLEHGIAEGVVRSDVDLVATANLLNSMLTSIARWYQPGGRLGPDDVLEQVRRFVAGLVDIPARPRP
jgi:TetR/AcrR family transcriptional regulator, cholesterol catabolism regulator